MLWQSHVLVELGQREASPAQVLRPGFMADSCQCMTKPTTLKKKKKTWVWLRVGSGKSSINLGLDEQAGIKQNKLPGIKGQPLQAEKFKPAI